MTCVRLLRRVLNPLLCTPHGDTGGCAAAVRPSPPPCGWSIGFIATPRTVGRTPRQRLRPALPIDSRLCSALPTSPMVARQSMCTLRISPERSLSCAYEPSRASTCTCAPAERASCAPLPGCISTQCTSVPIGMLRSGSVLPALIGACVGHELRADLHALRREHVAALAVGVDQQREMRAAVRVVLEALDLRGDAVLGAPEVDDSQVVLVAAALVAHGDAAVIVAATAATLRLDQRPVGLALVQLGRHDFDERAAAG